MNSRTVEKQFAEEGRAKYGKGKGVNREGGEGGMGVEVAVSKHKFVRVAEG